MKRQRIARAAGQLSEERLSILVSMGFEFGEVAQLTEEWEHRFDQVSGWVGGGGARGAGRRREGAGCKRASRPHRIAAVVYSTARQATYEGSALRDLHPHSSTAPSMAIGCVQLVDWMLWHNENRQPFSWLGADWGARGGITARELALWITLQREYRARGLLPADALTRFDAIGVQWDQSLVSRAEQGGGE